MIDWVGVIVVFVGLPVMMWLIIKFEESEREQEIERYLAAGVVKELREMGCLNGMLEGG